MLAILLVVGGLAVWGFQHLGKIEERVASLQPARDSSTVTSTASSTDSSTHPSPGSSTSASALSTQAANIQPSPINTSGNMLRYVHRSNAILRDEPKPSGHILKREMKGAAVTLVSEDKEGWAKVMDGDTAGYMRSSLLGPVAPK